MFKAPTFRQATLLTLAGLSLGAVVYFNVYDGRGQPHANSNAIQHQTALTQGEFKQPLDKTINNRRNPHPALPSKQQQALQKLRSQKHNRAERERHESEQLALLNDELLYHPSAQAREQALIDLLHNGDEAAYAIIPQALADNDIQVRQLAINALAEIGTSTLPVLGQVLFNEAEPTLRHQAADALASLNSPAAQALLEAALSDSDQQVRQQAEFWLNEIDWRSLQNEAEADTESPSHQPSADARITEIWDIRQHNKAGAAGLLANTLQRDSNPEVRTEALLALADMDDKTSHALIPQALTDTHTDVRRLAIEFIGARDSEQTHVLGQVLLNEPNPELRLQAMDLLVKQQSPAAKALLEMALQDDNEMLKAEAEYLLQTYQTKPRP